jgi:hypothetical protein
VEIANAQVDLDDSYPDPDIAELAAAYRVADGLAGQHTAGDKGNTKPTRAPLVCRVNHCAAK